MNKVVNSISADGQTLLGTSGKWYASRGERLARATLFVTGDFGSGTVTLQASPDNGTTWVGVPDAAGNTVSFTANGIINFELFSNPENPVMLRYNLAGSSSPAITCTLFTV